MAGVTFKQGDLVVYDNATTTDVIFGIIIKVKPKRTVRRKYRDYVIGWEDGTKTIEHSNHLDHPEEYLGFRDKLLKARDTYETCVAYSDSACTGVSDVGGWSKEAGQSPFRDKAKRIKQGVLESDA